jgi:hypothetical protein
MAEQLCLHEKYTCTFETTIKMPFSEYFSELCVHLALNILQVFCDQFVIIFLVVIP